MIYLATFVFSSLTAIISTDLYLVVPTLANTGCFELIRLVEQRQHTTSTEVKLLVGEIVTVCLNLHPMSWTHVFNTKIRGLGAKLF